MTTPVADQSPRTPTADSSIKRLKCGRPPVVFSAKAILAVPGVDYRLPKGWTHKVCPGCRIIHPREEFRTQTRCRPCISQYAKTPEARDRRRKAYRANSQAVITAAAKWREKNRDLVAHYSRRARHGITRPEYEAMNALQDGGCAICRVKPDRPLFVDHDHASGRIRGLLCDLCNRGIGMLREDPMVLRNAAEYVEAHRA